MSSGNKVKLEDGTIVDEPWSEWEFILKDGGSIKAKFTDKEIEKMKLENPEIKWTV